MREMVIQTIQSYVFLSSLTFIPILVGLFIFRNVDCNKNQTWNDIASCLICLGLMVGVFWLIHTLRYIVYFTFQKPLSPERLQEILHKIKNNPA